MEDIRELAWKGNLPNVRHLVEQMGVDVNQPHRMNGTTRTALRMQGTLHWAIQGGYSNVVSYLLSKGANPNTPDNKGITPIDLAAKAPNSIRSLLGLPPVETSAGQSASKDGYAASQSAVPLPSTPSPLTPLVSTSATLSSSSSAPASTPAPAYAQTVAPTVQRTQPVAFTPTPVLESTIFVRHEGAKDVVELDLPISSLSVLEEQIRADLKESGKIRLIRKLPNILIVKDRDVARLKNGDILEVAFN